jgi:hypothetical protein
VGFAWRAGPDRTKFGYSVASCGACTVEIDGVIVTRLGGAMTLEQNDEWRLSSCYMTQAGLQLLSDTDTIRFLVVAR